MATRYTLTKGFTIEVNTLLQRRVLKAAAPRIASEKAGTLQYLCQRGYKNAITQVGRFLESPDLPDIESSGAHVVTLQDADGKPVRIKTGHFNHLTDDYIQTPPESATFWRKRGFLYARYMAQVGAAPGAGTVTTKVLGTPITRLRHTRAHIQIEFSKLKDPMDTYIRRYFVLGMKNLYVDGRDWVAPGVLPKRGKKNYGKEAVTLGQFVYVESQRPVISSITSRLGRNLLKLLRSNV